MRISRFSRRSRLPDDARAALGLAPGEHVLSAARCRDGSWLAATATELVTPGWRAGWVRVARADWDDETQRLRVDLIGDAETPEARHAFVLDDPAFLPETVRERVTDSIVVSRHVRVAGRSAKEGVRVVARRARGRDDLQWQVIADPGVDPADPQVSAVAAQALAQLREELGG